MTGMERSSTKADWSGDYMTKRDWLDYDVSQIVQMAKDMNKTYRTVSPEHAEDLDRAVGELIELYSRVEQ